MMTYQSVWWYPNYIEYGSGLKPPKTWPNVVEQYRRPHALYDLRYYDLPEEQYQAKLYYNLPRLGKPQYRATFRDKPHTVSRHYPNGWPEGKPPGFHGRMYYEDGPPQFKYEGPKQDKLYWLERPPYLPTFPKERPVSGQERTFSTMRGLNEETKDPQMTGQVHQRLSAQSDSGYNSRLAGRADTTYTTYGSHYKPGDRMGSVPLLPSHLPNPSKRVTQDGVGYL